jgi:hypothetical protein
MHRQTEEQIVDVLDVTALSAVFNVRSCFFCLFVSNIAIEVLQNQLVLSVLPVRIIR